MTLFQGFEVFLHYAVLFVQAVYVMFAFMQTRQVKLMNASFKTPQAGFFKLLSQIHLFVSIGIFIISLVLLL